jgi:hypothetical protein
VLDFSFLKKFLSQPGRLKAGKKASDVQFKTVHHIAKKSCFKKSSANDPQSGDKLVIAYGINVVSDHALDNAMNNAMGSTAESEAVPYLSYALTVRNFADNPEQAMLTAAVPYVGAALAISNLEDNPAQAMLTALGRYVGKAINDEFFRSVA